MSTSLGNTMLDRSDKQYVVKQCRTTFCLAQFYEISTNLTKSSIDTVVGVMEQQRTTFLLSNFTTIERVMKQQRTTFLLSTFLYNI